MKNEVDVYVEIAKQIYKKNYTIASHMIKKANGSSVSNRRDKNDMNIRGNTKSNKK